MAVKTATATAAVPTIVIQEESKSEPGRFFATLMKANANKYKALNGDASRWAALFTSDDDGDSNLLNLLIFCLEGHDEAGQETIHEKVQEFILAYFKKCIEEGRDLGSLLSQLEPEAMPAQA